MKAGNQSSKSGKSSRNERSPASGREPAAGRARPGAREKILAAALELFSVNGFDGTTTRDIATRAGANLGLIQYYFGNKEALWKAVVDGVHEGLRTSLAATGAGVESPAQVASAIRSAVYFAAKNPAFVRLMNDEGKRKSARMRWLVDRHGKPMFDALAGFFSEARERGFVPDAEPLHLYYMFLGAVGLIFSQAPECKRLTGTDPTVDEAVIEAHADAVVALFVRNPTMGTRG
jgi:AcrR family transcriptional regulator